MLRLGAQRLRGSPLRGSPLLGSPGRPRSVSGCEGWVGGPRPHRRPAVQGLRQTAGWGALPPLRDGHSVFFLIYLFSFPCATVQSKTVSKGPRCKVSPTLIPFPSQLLEWLLYLSRDGLHVGKHRCFYCPSLAYLHVAFYSMSWRSSPSRWEDTHANKYVKPLSSNYN